jgi:hypothetical protein
MKNGRPFGFGFGHLFTCPPGAGTEGEKKRPQRAVSVNQNFRIILNSIEFEKKIKVDSLNFEGK